MRKMAALIAAGAMLTSSTIAFADSKDQQPQQQQGALAPGNAAGVEQARSLGTNWLMIGLGLAVVGGGVALALSSSHGSNSTTTTQNP